MSTWRVQAFLLKSYIDMDHDYAYVPRYFRWGFFAKRWARTLADSFGPGMARIECTKENQ